MASISGSGSRLSRRGREVDDESWKIGSERSRGTSWALVSSSNERLGPLTWLLPVAAAWTLDRREASRTLDGIGLVEYQEPGTYGSRHTDKRRRYHNPHLVGIRQDGETITGNGRKDDGDWQGSCEGHSELAKYEKRRSVTLRSLERDITDTLTIPQIERPISIELHP